MHVHVCCKREGMHLSVNSCLHLMCPREKGMCAEEDGTRNGKLMKGNKNTNLYPGQINSANKTEDCRFMLVRHSENGPGGHYSFSSKHDNRFFLHLFF